MKWKKLGRIFDPTEHKLLNNCLEFAQSPQTLVFDKFVRIYFSTREMDKVGKYLSHVAFVDMDKSFEKVINVSTSAVVSLGKLGCYDEHGIFPFNVFKDGEKVLGYIGGWSRRVAVSVDGSIGLAISDDNGVSFKKIGDGPILTSSLNEPFMIGDPFVAKFDDYYHMWYIFGVKWLDNANGGSHERVYKIGKAKSEDGITWITEGGRQLISDKLDSVECQALPTVIKLNNIYHMLFCYRKAIGFRSDRDGGYKLGYACSVDLINWVRNDDMAGINLSESGWDSEMQCYPHMFQCNDQIYLLYNGNEFGRHGFGLAILEDTAQAKEIL